MKDKKDQIGCGYCSKEKGCKMKESGINKAKLGCPEWLHFQDDPEYKFKGKYINQ